MQKALPDNAFTGRDIYIQEVLLTLYSKGLNDYRHDILPE